MPAAEPRWFSGRMDLEAPANNRFVNSLVWVCISYKDVFVFLSLNVSLRDFTGKRVGNPTKAEPCQCVFLGMSALSCFAEVVYFCLPHVCREIKAVFTDMIVFRSIKQQNWPHIPSHTVKKYNDIYDYYKKLIILRFILKQKVQLHWTKKLRAIFLIVHDLFNFRSSSIELPVRWETKISRGWTQADQDRSELLSF